MKKYYAKRDEVVAIQIVTQSTYDIVPIYQDKGSLKTTMLLYMMKEISL